MKEIEDVTGKIGSVEAVVPGEEGAGGATETSPLPEEGEAEPAGESGHPNGEEDPGEKAPGVAGEGGSPAADPWSALAGLGELLAGALAAARNPESASGSPLVERDPGTDRLHLKIPLPQPETAVRIGEALGVLAEALRGIKPGS